MSHEKFRFPEGHIGVEVMIHTVQKQGLLRLTCTRSVMEDDGPQITTAIFRDVFSYCVESDRTNFETI